MSKRNRDNYQDCPHYNGTAKKTSNINCHHQECFHKKTNNILHYFIKSEKSRGAEISRFLKNKDTNFKKEFLNLQDSEGNTILHTALTEASGKYWGATILYKHGARSDIKNRDGISPQDIIRKILDTGKLIKITSNKLEKILQSPSMDDANSKQMQDTKINNEDIEEPSNKKAKLSDIPYITKEELNILGDNLNFNYYHALNIIIKQICDDSYNFEKINEVNKNGDTLAHIAFNHKNFNLAELLLGKGTDINIKNNNGDTVINLIHKMGFNDVFSKYFLSQDHSSNNIITKKQLQLDLSFNNHMIRYHLKLDTVIELIHKGLYNFKAINEQDKYGDTVLHKAITCGNIALAKLFVSKGARTNIENNEGYAVEDLTDIFKIDAYQEISEDQNSDHSDVQTMNIDEVICTGQLQ